MNQNDMDRYHWRTGHYWNRDLAPMKIYSDTDG